MHTCELHVNLLLEAGCHLPPSPSLPRFATIFEDQKMEMVYSNSISCVHTASYMVYQSFNEDSDQLLNKLRNS